MSKIKNLVEQKFNKLLVISRAENTKQGRAQWNCKCDCGNSLIVRGSYLLNGHTQSCGCLRKEKSSELNTVHGKTNTKIHAVWKSMKQRCFDENIKNYEIYGGRGITVCDEWKHDFQSFYDYVSQLPHYGEEGYSIDRINNNGNYEPGNVKWSTRKEQARNRRSCRYIYYEGEFMTVAELSEKTGVPARKLYSKLYKKDNEYARGMA